MTEILKCGRVAKPVENVPKDADSAAKMSKFKKLAIELGKIAGATLLTATVLSGCGKQFSKETYPLDTKDALGEVVIGGDVTTEIGDLAVPDAKPDVKQSKTCAEKEADGKKTVYAIMLGGVLTSVAEDEEVTEDGQTYTVDISHGKVLLLNNDGEYKIAVNGQTIVASDGDEVEIFGETYTVTVVKNEDGTLSATLTNEGSELTASSVVSADVTKDIANQYETSYYGRRYVLQVSGEGATTVSRDIMEEGTEDFLALEGYNGTMLQLAFTDALSGDGHPILAYSGIIVNGGKTTVVGGEWVLSQGKELVFGEVSLLVEVEGLPVHDVHGDPKCKSIWAKVSINGNPSSSVKESSTLPVDADSGVYLKKGVPGANGKDCAELGFVGKEGGEITSSKVILCTGEGPFSVKGTSTNSVQFQSAFAKNEGE